MSKVSQVFFRNLSLIVIVKATFPKQHPNRAVQKTLKNQLIYLSIGLFSFSKTPYINLKMSFFQNFPDKVLKFIRENLSKIIE